MKHSEKDGEVILDFLLSVNTHDGKIFKHS